MATILIFEDNSSLALCWREALEEKNHHVCCCTTVQDALAMTEKLMPDMIITDMMIKQGGQFIPEGGLTLLARLKIKYSPPPGIIGVSGFKPGLYCQATALEIAKNSGIDLALYKPFSIEQLLAAVEQLLASKKDVKSQTS